MQTQKGPNHFDRSHIMQAGRKMEMGLSAEEAYQLACQKYYQEKKTREIEKRIQVEQAQELGTISPIFLQEEFLKEEMNVAKSAREMSSSLSKSNKN